MIEMPGPIPAVPCQCAGSMWVSTPVAYFLSDPQYAEYHDTLIGMTAKFDEHPEGYDGPCMCKLCQSYG